MYIEIDEKREAEMIIIPSLVSNEVRAEMVSALHGRRASGISFNFKLTDVVTFAIFSHLRYPAQQANLNINMQAK